MTPKTVCRNYYKIAVSVSFLFFGLHVINVQAEEASSNQAGEASVATPVATPVIDWLSQGKAYINFRYRYEFVDDDAFDKDAKASTLRTRLGYESALIYGFQALFEIEDVSPIGNELYNDTVNGQDDRPIVADAPGTEVNQAFLAYKDLPETNLMFGRYMLALDNVRFIGDVGWRQNNQTFDGAQLTNQFIPDTKLTYAYFFNVNRISGDDSPAGDVDSNVHVFNAKWTGCPVSNVTVYSYLLDLKDLPDVSSASFGGHLDASVDVDEAIAVLYDLEYAYQTDYEDNSNNYAANYYRAEAGVELHSITLKGGYEVLGSDNGDIAFTTPLATLHAWNGWADKFLNTPDTGLRDAYGGIIYTVDGLHEAVDGTKFTAMFHDFTADDGGDNYGTEWDFDISQTFLDRFMAGVTYAYYNADDFSTDTEKLIFTLAANFKQS